MITEHLAALLGLTKHEKKVWQALAESPLHMSELALCTRIPRTTLYTAVRTLKERGIISTRAKGKAVFVSLNSKVSLSDIFAEASTALHAEGNIKVISTTKTGQQTGFTFIKGKHAMLKVWESLAKPGVNRFYAIQPTRSLLHTIKLFNPGAFVPINEAIKKHDIVVDVLMKEDGVPTYMSQHQNRPDVQKKILQSFLGRAADATLVDNRFLNNNAEILMTSEKAFLMNWENEIGISIENKDMVDLLLELFELAKGYGKRIDFNTYIRGFLERLQK